MKLTIFVPDDIECSRMKVESLLNCPKIKWSFFFGNRLNERLSNIFLQYIRTHTHTHIYLFGGNEILQLSELIIVYIYMMFSLSLSLPPSRSLRFLHFFPEKNNEWKNKKQNLR